MSNRYIISDTHIGHKNISKFRQMRKLENKDLKWNPEGIDEGRPKNELVPMTSEDHWERAFEGIASLRKRDTVFMLGDMVLYKDHLPRMKALPQRKILIVGNHDLYDGRGITMQDLVDAYDQVIALHKYKKFWMSHAPIHPMELRGKRNLHGHCHPYLMLNEDGTQDTRYVSVCVEYAGYTPISFEYATSDEYQQECWKKWKEDYEPKWGNKP